MVPKLHSLESCPVKPINPRLCFNFPLNPNNPWVLSVLVGPWLMTQNTAEVRRREERMQK